MMQIDLRFIEILPDGHTVYYQGKCLDKCAISILINRIAVQKGYSLSSCDWSDYRWPYLTKKTLVSYLIRILNK